MAVARRSSQPAADKLADKGDKRRRLERQAIEFLRRRYPDLDVLMSLEGTNAAQTAALVAWRAWVATIWAELDLRIGQVNAAPDLPASGWRSIQLDREALRLADPSLRLRQWVRLT